MTSPQDTKPKAPRVARKITVSPADQAAQAQAQVQAQVAVDLEKALLLQEKMETAEELVASVNSQMPTAMQTPDMHLENELHALRKAFKEQEQELAQLRYAQSNVITANYREAKAGQDGQEPIAVIDKAGHIWPFTTNHNDRISLLKMAVTYIYNEKDLAFALAQAKKIRENTADVNQQIIGAPLARGVAIPKHVEAAQTFQGMEVKGSSLLAVHPEKYKLAVNANQFP